MIKLGRKFAFLTPFMLYSLHMRTEKQKYKVNWFLLAPLLRPPADVKTLNT